MKPSVLVTVSLLLAGYSVHAGTPVGSSSLIGALDYSDTFTLSLNGGIAGRPDNVYPVNAPGISLENSYGSPARSWQNALWSLNTDLSIFPGSGYPGGSGSGSATGMTQTGGGWDGSFLYGLRSSFVVQFDSVQAIDRVDIFTGSTGNIAGGMAIFFRNPGNPGGHPEIGIYNGAAEFNTGFNSGIAAPGQWHNYAVRFAPSELEFYVDQVSRGVLNLNTFNGGSFLGYSNQWVGVGNTGSTVDAGFPISWSDNFQAGAAVPEPAGAALLLAGGALLGVRRRRAA
jgi:hypothetical protein